MYLDKLRLSEQEELALLSSVNNEYDCKKLQHAALVQDRAIRRPGAWGGEDAKGGGKRWTRQSVHMTTNEGGDLSSEDEKADDNSDDGEIVDEDTAVEHYTAYMTYQGAKAKYKEILKGRGVDQHAVDKRNQERLRLAKQRSYCSACKRRGHWHKDPECPLRQKSSTGTTSAVGAETVQSVNFVHQCFVTDSGDQACDELYMTDYDLESSPCLCLRQLSLATAEYDAGIFCVGDLRQQTSAIMEFDIGASPCVCVRQLSPASSYFMTEECSGEDFIMNNEKGIQHGPQDDKLLAITDTACTKTVAGYAWFEKCVQVADSLGFPAQTLDENEHFKFGASKIYRSMLFAIHGKQFGVRVSIVPCNVPLLFSRPVLGSLGMCYDVAKQQVGLSSLRLQELPLLTSPRGIQHFWSLILARTHCWKSCRIFHPKQCISRHSKHT